MIVAIKKKSILILHLEAKYATKKRGLKKWNLREKLGKGHLDYKKSTVKYALKVNG